MLVMRRRAGEILLIGDAIEIEVLEVSGTRVKLMITLDNSTPLQEKRHAAALQSPLP